MPGRCSVVGWLRCSQAARCRGRRGAVSGGACCVPAPPGPVRRLPLPCPECACAGRGGWFERGGAAMAGPGPCLSRGRSAQGLQRRCLRGPAGVRRGRGGRPAGGGGGTEKPFPPRRVPEVFGGDGGWGASVLSLGVRCKRRAVAYPGSARRKWGLNRLCGSYVFLLLLSQSPCSDCLRVEVLKSHPYLSRKFP